jgi:hypothetical protein
MKQHNIFIPVNRYPEFLDMKLRYQVKKNLPKLSAHEYIMQCAYTVDQAIDIKKGNEDASST